MRILLAIVLPLACSFEHKLCITCKHFMKAENNRYAKCKMFPIIENTMEDYVSGYSRPQSTEYNFCSTARTFGFMCSKNGKYYEKIELFTEEEHKDKDEPTR